MPPSGSRPRIFRPPFGVNVVGYVTGNLGLGVSTRHTISMLKRAGVRVAATDIDPGLGRGGHDRTHRLVHPANPRRTPYLITLFHVNPPGLASYVRVRPELTRSDRITAIVPFWELEKLPPEWIPVLEAMDVILTPSTFIRAAIEKALPEALCIDYPQMVYGLEDVRPDRERWGMPSDANVFVSSFDLASAIERKNPHAVVAAFQQAFPDTEDVRLVLKANSVGVVPDDNGLWRDLMKRAQDDKRIRVISDVLSYPDVLSLYASADCLVSLHRSEGLGLSMMEAMYLGKPVIATGWSGNLDFMTPDNSRLVDFDLVPVVCANAHYAAMGALGAVWADASVSEAARHMQEVTADPDAARSMGHRAKQDLLELRAKVDRADVVDRLREVTGPESVMWQWHPDRRARLRRLAKGAEIAAWVARARQAPAPVRALARPARRVIRRLRPGIDSFPTSSSNHAPVRPPSPGPVDLDRFFAEFSDEFRGSEATITERLRIYVPHLTALKPVRDGKNVVDVGCGRGELLSVLSEAGVKCVGVDTNVEAVSRAVEAGLDAVVSDGLSYLAEQPDGSLGAITGIHIVEHLKLEQRLSLFAECYRALAPGGAVVFETPNPQSLHVGAYTFWLDPSHLQPVPPQLLEFSLRFCGFRTETLFLQPLKPQARPKGRYVRALFDSIYGFADYSVIGHKNA